MNLMRLIQDHQPHQQKNRTNLGCSLLFAVIEECPKQAAVEVIEHGDQEQLVELKGCWELHSDKQR